MSFPPAGQAMKLYCEAERDFSEFQRAFHLDSAHATQIFSRECLPDLLQGLYLFTSALAQDIIKDDISSTPLQELPIHG
jgi:hypothetical protein